MDLREISRLISEVESYVFPMGFTLVTMYFQWWWKVFNAKTFGADLAAAATAMVVSVGINKAAGIGTNGIVGSVILMVVCVGIAWITCLFLAQPDKDPISSYAGSRPNRRHKFSAFIGLVSLFLASWFVKQLLAELGATASKVI